jgi:hypothetical protein
VDYQLSEGFAETNAGRPVDRGIFQMGVTQQKLNRAQVRSRFPQLGRICVP